MENIKTCADVDRAFNMAREAVDKHKCVVPAELPMTHVALASHFDTYRTVHCKKQPSPPKHKWVEVIAHSGGKVAHYKYKIEVTSPNCMKVYKLHTPHYETKPMTHKNLTFELNKKGFFTLPTYKMDPEGCPFPIRYEMKCDGKDCDWIKRHGDKKFEYNTFQRESMMGKVQTVQVIAHSATAY